MSATRDMLNDMELQPLLAPAEYVADQVGVGMDTTDGDSATIVVQTGGTVDAGLAVIAEEADVLGGPYTAVDAKDLVAALPAVGLAADSTFKIGYIGLKKFFRAPLTIPGASDVSVVGILTHLHQLPAD